MSRVTRPALRGSWLGTLLRVWNPVMKLILGSPIHWPLSRWFALISWTGRNTGRRYSTPVSYVLADGAMWVTTGDRWWRNVVGGGTLELRLRGDAVDGNATVITDPADSEREHQRLFRDHGWFRWLSGIPGDGVGGADPVALQRAIGAGRVLVRIDTVP